jgi:cytochrome c oxidase subunit II
MSSINIPPQRSEPTLTPPAGLVVIGLIVMAVVIVALIITVPTFLPAQASTQAQQVDQLFLFLLAVGGGVFVLVEGVLLMAILRYRAKPGDLADGVPIHGNTALEAWWTAIPALIVVVIAVYSAVVYGNTRAIPPNELTVESVAARYAWTFNYRAERDDIPANINYDLLKPEIREAFESDGFIGFSQTQLYTWVGQPVVVSMTAQDVNHAFWVPAMRVKQDVLVGRTTEIRFTPTEAGAYRIVCAELCGAGHGNMAGQIGAQGDMQGAWLIVYENEEQYLNEFFIPEVTRVILPPDDPALQGRQILASGKYPCATCHVLDDLAWAGNIGPNLNGIADRIETRAAAAGIPVPPEYLVQSMRHPGDYLVPGFGNLMPQFNETEGQPNYMPESDLDAIVAYLLTQGTNPALAGPPGG